MSGMYVSLGRWRLWVRSPVTTDNFPILYFVTVLIRGTIIKFRGHRGFNPEFSSPESPVCTTAVHCHKMTREMVVYKSVWTQREKKDQRSEISTTGLRYRIAEGPRAFAGSALSECLFSLLPPLCSILSRVQTINNLTKVRLYNNNEEIEQQKFEKNQSSNNVIEIESFQIRR